MQKEQQQLLITSYNQEDYKISIHLLWDAIEVLPQPSYLMSLCKLAIIAVTSLCQDITCESIPDSPPPFLNFVGQRRAWELD